MKVWSRVVIAAACVAFAFSAVAVHAASPSPAVPGAPRNLKATAGDKQVSLTWSPPSGGATGYTITTAPADFPRTNTQNTTFLVSGLKNGTSYTFSVRAANAAGYGPSARVIAIPHGTPPSAPTNLAATQGPGANEITLSWTPPTSSGSSSTIDHYTVTVSPGAISQQTDAATTTYVASNLAANITYTFSVTATNGENTTGPAATVYAPIPPGAAIGLQPTAGGANTSITASGQLFLPNESITLYWDDASHVAAAVVTDANGAFTMVVTPFPGDKPAVHELCASVPPKPCASFTLLAPPTPSPTPPPSASPSGSSTPPPTQSPRASAARLGGGSSGFNLTGNLPLLFLVIIAILGLLGGIAYWVLSGRRRAVAPPSATVVHLATRPDYVPPYSTPARPTASAAPPSPAPTELPAAGPPTVPPPAPAPAPPIEPPALPNPPAAPDEPPDLPVPGD
jgi:hypothetical protein